MTTPIQPRPAAPQYRQPVPPVGGPYRPQPSKSTSGMAITAVVLGLIALTACRTPGINQASSIFMVVAMIGTVFGIISIVKTGSNGKKRGRDLAITGTLLCILALIISLYVPLGGRTNLYKIITESESATSTSAVLTGNEEGR